MLLTQKQTLEDKDEHNEMKISQLELLVVELNKKIADGLNRE